MLEDDLKKLAGVVKQTKEGVVKNRGGAAEMNSFTHVWRRGEAICVFISPPDRDLQLMLARMAFVGLSADQVALSNEVWHAETKINPDTGNEWLSGEMGDYVHNHPDAIASGVMGEAIMTTIYNRNGEFGYVHQPFRQVNDEVIWDEKITFGAEEHAGGVIHDAMTSFMAEETMMAKIDAEEASMGVPPDAELNRVWKEAIAEAAVYARLKALAKTERIPVTIALMLKAGSERDKRLRKQLDDIGMSYLIGDPHTGHIFGPN